MASDPAPTSPSDADAQICGLVAELARRIDAHVRSRGDRLELTATQAVALRELTGPLTMRELAARMCCEPSNVTFVVDRLERRGLLERRLDPADRRVRRLVLTDSGTALRARLLDLLTEDSPLGCLTDAERRALCELLGTAVGRGDRPGDTAEPAPDVGVSSYAER
ncbi:MarR family transcriptional regulator [Thermobifida halotolerans]|uniref:MarR family transcriptional regulator n=1 Tax=Thermobifida halotolerans TaxID=483545 RepID=A0AA97LUW8_9ACTN|nr:MarR family transcriptional regulator [Thermobifida halotolerans]UOE18514.1 MarR family transcriptional regulator [Thermobifida halotolerans]